MKCLTPLGEIFIGDISFEKREELETYRKKSRDLWDEDELYIIGSEMVELLKKEGIDSKYTQISSCAGVLKIS